MREGSSTRTRCAACCAGVSGVSGVQVRVSLCERERGAAGVTCGWDGQPCAGDLFMQRMNMSIQPLRRAL